MKFAILALFVIIAAVSAKCLDGKKAVKPHSGMCACEWYASSEDGICCNGFYNLGEPNQAANLNSGPGNGIAAVCGKRQLDKRVRPCKVSNSNCFDLFNLGQCGAQCSPKTEDFFDGATLFMCSEFADKLWDECKKQEIFVTADWKCKSVGEELFNDNKTLFFETISAEERSSDCFNAASAPSTAAATALVAVGFLTGVRNPLFITLALICVSSLMVSATCLTTQDPISVEYACRCDWYKDSTCCASSAGAVNPWGFNAGCVDPSRVDIKYACVPLSAPCRDQIDFAECAADCSPKQQDIWNVTATPAAMRICDKQSKILYDSCKNDETWDSDENKCRKVGDKWSNSEDFAAYLGFQQNDDDCWNASSVSYISVAVVALVGLLNFF